MASKDEEDKKAAAAKKTAAIKKANDAVQASKTVEPPIKKYEGTDLTEFNKAVDNMIDETVREDEEIKEQQKQLSTRQGIASGLEDLSRRGALTGDLLKQARERATTAGVSDEQFNSFMDKNRIRPSNFATAPKSSSPQEAAQNALFEAEHGSALRAMDIRSNDPNYKFGSGSVLNQPARRVGPESSKFRNAARRLRRKGYTAQAAQMEMAGEMLRMREPNIDTPELRRQRKLQKILAGKEAQRQDKAYASSAGVKLGQSGEVNRGDVMQTSEFRDVNGNGVEDREEGIYRKGENFDASQASIPKRSFEQYMKELKAVAGGNRDMFGTA
jgi:hypothetical protein